MSNIPCVIRLNQRRLIELLATGQLTICIAKMEHVDVAQKKRHCHHFHVTHLTPFVPFDKTILSTNRVTNHEIHV